MTLHRPTVFICLILVFMTASAVTQAEPLITDRPDLAEASETVQPLEFQIEASFALSYQTPATGKQRSYNFPTLVRFGLIENFELRVESDWLSIQERAGSTNTYFTDLSVGAKIYLFEQQGWIPSSGLLINASLPSGHSSVTSDSVEPSLKYLGSWDISERIANGTNFGIALPARDSFGDLFAVINYAIAFSFGLHEIDPDLSIFVENAGSIPLHGGKNIEQIFSSGFAYLVNDNLQLDLFSQVGLNNNTDDLLTGMGISYRY